MNYTIEKIENGVALMRYEDGSYASITLEADMTLEQVDDIAFAYAPKPAAPDNIAVGHTKSRKLNHTRRLKTLRMRMRKALKRQNICTTNFSLR